MDMWFDFFRWIAVLQVEKGKPIIVPSFCNGEFLASPSAVKWNMGFRYTYGERVDMGAFLMTCFKGQVPKVCRIGYKRV